MVHSPEERHQLNLIIGADARSEKQKRVQRYLGEVEKRTTQDERMNEMLRESESKRQKATKGSLFDIFSSIFNKLKETNKELWAVRVIQKWWRKKIKILRHQQYLRWLPIDIDPDNCDFRDVDRVLKVLDEYAL